MANIIKVNLVDHRGNAYVLDVEVGQSVMEAAVIDGVPGIPAECGGSPQCATCSVFVPEKWVDVSGSPDDLEVSVLKFNNKLDKNRRLSCQLIAQESWDGLTLQIPESQY